MLKLPTLFLYAVSCSAYASIPDITCQEVKGVFVNPTTLSHKDYESKTRYRLKDGNLYLSDPDRAEYLYNKVVQIESGRYVSGYKTFIFDSESFQTAFAVHAYKDEVRISRLVCK